MSFFPLLPLHVSRDSFLFVLLHMLCLGRFNLRNTKKAITFRPSVLHRWCFWTQVPLYIETSSAHFLMAADVSWWKCLEFYNDAKWFYYLHIVLKDDYHRKGMLIKLTRYRIQLDNGKNLWSRSVKAVGRICDNPTRITCAASYKGDDQQVMLLAKDAGIKRAHFPLLSPRNCDFATFCFQEGLRQEGMFLILTLVAAAINVTNRYRSQDPSTALSSYN